MFEEIKKDDGKLALCCFGVAEWRKWLEENHQQETSVWLILFHKDSNKPCINTEDANCHALCYGWVEGEQHTRNDESYYLLFSGRNPNNSWNPKNRERLEKMDRAGFMAPAGEEMVKQAKLTGTWTTL